MNVNKMAIIYLALGSNVGNRKGNLLKAIELLREKIIVNKISSIYETKPVGYFNQRNFYNCALKARTVLSANQLLYFARIVEKKLKRRKTIRNGPRTIDVDILFYGNQRINRKNLVVPHPRIFERDFVVVPLLEIGKRAKENKDKMKNTIIKKRLFYS
ncbi:2-amino-4-hydroxy-6-hydroxymethyldihydropteridine diphosphokinase [Candidatus Woesearchaeota archaeon]|nr:2-amino-4-hydroxy-6-hydroxymethyldihydropteridine diphosphokinase [Candidatus Woesearchaeota archaeon]